MKNHWLQIYKKRNSSYWTTEFFCNDGSCYNLNPRRVDLLDFKENQLPQGSLILIFKNAVSGKVDQFWSNFFSNCQNHIDNWFNRISKYKNLKKIESYEFYDLSYASLSLGSNFEDLILKFHYEDAKHFPENG